ncbi:MAG TPA: elongation factor G [Bacteroidia bacterium]|nr:elongation factor G [Bacteroidia bacterium]
MKRKELAWMRNMGIMAHIDAGKTTVTENILFATGRSHKVGSVDDGNTTTDYTSAERKRGITIQSAAVTTHWTWQGQTYQINLIDTPGHIDFNGEVERSLRVLDGVLALFCGVAGVETQSRTVWAQATKFGLPRVAFVNKMDRPGADFGRVIGQMREILGANAVALQLPWWEGDRFCGLIDLVEEQAWYWAEGEKQPQRRNLPAHMLPEIAAASAEMLERLAEVDDDFLGAYLEEASFVDADVVRKAIRRATLVGKLVPVLTGAAYRNIGVQPLLDAVVQYLPAPDEGHFHSDDAGFSGLVFKTLTDRFAGRAGFLRVRSGRLRAGESVLCPRTGTVERIARIFRMQGAQREELSEALAGDIVAITGFKEMLSGDTLCDPKAPVVLESIDFPAPVIDIAIELVGKGQESKLSMALSQLTAEDPALHFRTDADSGQLVISGLGELHLEVVVDRLQDDYGLEIRTGRPAVAYRTAITRKLRHHEKLQKQNGGKGQFAEMVIEVSPLAEGTGFVFENGIVGGAIPVQFVPAIEKGLRNAMRRGLANGFPIDGVHVRLIDGSIHREDSDAMAFESCAVAAMLAACNAASPVTMEPVMQVDALCPEGYTGAVIADINRRRGRITGLEVTVQGQAIAATVPLSEMFGYVASLRGLSAGTGSYTMRLSHYAALPQAVAVQ